MLNGVMLFSYSMAKIPKAALEYFQNQGIKGGKLSAKSADGEAHAGATYRDREEGGRGAVGQEAAEGRINKWAMNCWIAQFGSTTVGAAKSALPTIIRAGSSMRERSISY
jgi:hypothetical protein